MEMVVEAAIKAHAFVSLAHPYYYQLSQTELIELVQAYRMCVGERAGIETFYRNYSASMIAELCLLGQKYQLLPTAGSDFHGMDKTDSLICFPEGIVDEIQYMFEKK